MNWSIVTSFLATILLCKVRQSATVLRDSRREGVNVTGLNLFTELGKILWGNGKQLEREREGAVDARVLELI